MAKLIVTGSGFINKVTELSSGAFAVELSLEAYSSKQEDDTYKSTYTYITAYTKKPELLPAEFKDRPFAFELSGLTAKPAIQGDKAYANLRANFESATPIVPKSE